MKLCWRLTRLLSYQSAAAPSNVRAAMVTCCEACDGAYAGNIHHSLVRSNVGQAALVIVCRGTFSASSDRDGGVSDVQGVLKSLQAAAI